MKKEGQKNESKPKSLFETMRDVLRLNHMSLSTEKTYIHWCKRYVLFHNRRHPRVMGAKEITEFLSYLATNKNVAAATQNQALNAIVYLYTKVLKQSPGVLDEIIRARKPKHPPEE